MDSTLSNRPYNHVPIAGRSFGQLWYFRLQFGDEQASFRSLCAVYCEGLHIGIIPGDVGQGEWNFS